MPSILNATTSSGLVTSADNSGSLQLATNNGTTAVTIDTSQNVGIGVSSPSSKLDVRGANNATNYRFGDSTGANALNIYNNTTSGVVDLGTSASAMSFSNAGTERMQITAAGLLQFNSGYGSVATAYGCRAWVNFNGTGTVAIRASGNVSSITDHSTGNYTINMTNAMPNANYSVTGTCSEDSDDSRSVSLGFDNLNFTPTTSAFRINTRNFYTSFDVDCDFVFLHVIR